MGKNKQRSPVAPQQIKGETTFHISDKRAHDDVHEYYVNGVRFIRADLAEDPQKALSRIAEAIEKQTAVYERMEKMVLSMMKEIPQFKNR